jgi:ABC-2 type transport system ATP-binding protein
VSGHGSDDRNQGLRKRLGSTVALDGVSFTITPGTVTGFVGANVTGKSTTIRVVLGLEAADRGSALIGGRTYGSLRHPLRRRRHLQQITPMPAGLAA